MAAADVKYQAARGKSGTAEQRGVGPGGNRRTPFTGYMRFAYIQVMESALEAAINEWHASVNDGDLERSTRAVGDPVVVLGPKGAGPIAPEEFAAWVERSGIRLIPRSWHPVSERLMVVEQDASWSASKAPTRVATVFRVSGGKVTASLRLPDLKSALELAYICREMAATE